MKLIKSIVSLVLVAVIASMSCFLAGCGDSSKEKTGGKTLKIKAVELGYGTEWLDALIEGFKKKTGIDVQVDKQIGALGTSSITTELESLASDSDLMFGKFGFFAKYIYEGKVTDDSGNSYDCILEDLSDVYNAKVDEGSDKTILDKMNPQFSGYYNINDKYYGMSWSNGVMGFVRNKDVWDKLGLKDSDIPLTTDALFELADSIKSKTTPFIFSSKENYYDSYITTFMAQYEGKDNFKKFLNGVDPDGNVSQYIYTYDGALESLKFFEKLLNKKNNYHSASQASLDFTLMQGQFLSGNALFCLNGSWLENEMKANYKNVNIDFIKTPVISSIIDRLSTVKDDKALREVVNYIDLVDSGSDAQKPDGVSDEDIAIVTEARHIAFLNTGTAEQVIIPAYSKNKDNAKEFLKYMYSDEGLNSYYKAMGGLTLPATPSNGYDTGIKLSTFMKSSFDAVQSKNWTIDDTKAKYFVLASVSQHFNNSASPTVELYEGTSTPSEIVDANTDAINKKWNSIKQILG